MYRHVEYYPGDPILSLVETFKCDERPEKVNLSIGIYFDDEGKMPVLESVRRAEAERAAIPRPSPYLPMEGLDTYRSAVQRLLSAIRRGTTIKAFLKAQVLKWGRILITTLKPSA